MIVAGIAIAVRLWLHRQPGPSDQQLKVIPLTTYQGLEMAPSFAPDGSQVAFQWDQGDSKPHIYVKLIGPGDPLRITSGFGEYGPAWSPDGKQIAFIRRVDEVRMAAFVIPALGGVERKVADFVLPYTSVGAFPRRWVDWTADSRHLIVSGGERVGAGHGLFLVSLDGHGGRRSIIAPVAKAGVADLSPAMSPDGRTLAYCHVQSVMASDLFALSLSPDLQPAGEPRRLTADNRMCGSPTWTRDGRAVIFQSDRDGNLALWRVALDGSSPRPLVSLGTDAYDPAMSRRGTLVYARLLTDTNVWRQELASRTSGAPPPVNLISSTADDRNAHYSPDGTKRRIPILAVRRLGDLGLRKRRESVHPDHCDERAAHRVALLVSGWKKQIAFDSAAAGNFDIYVVDANGGLPRRLTDDPNADAAPSLVG